MPVRTILAGSAAAALVAAAGTAAAHHAYTAYDLQTRVTVSGVVKEFRWVNPHAELRLVVLGADGKPVEWSIEGGSPGRLLARDWSPTSLKPGDKAEIVLNPRRDGEPFGRMTRASVDGKPIGRQGNARQGNLNRPFSPPLDRTSVTLPGRPE